MQMYANFLHMYANLKTDLHTFSTPETRINTGFLCCEMAMYANMQKKCIK